MDKFELAYCRIQCRWNFTRNFFRVCIRYVVFLEAGPTIFKMYLTDFFFYKITENIVHYAKVHLTAVICFCDICAIVISVKDFVKSCLNRLLELNKTFPATNVHSAIMNLKVSIFSLGETTFLVKGMGKTSMRVLFARGRLWNTSPKVKWSR